MTEFVLSAPSDSFTPAVLGWFCNHLVKDFERKVTLCFKRSKGLKFGVNTWSNEELIRH